MVNGTFYLCFKSCFHKKLVESECKPNLSLYVAAFFITFMFESRVTNESVCFTWRYSWHSEHHKNTITQIIAKRNPYHDQGESLEIIRARHKKTCLWGFLARVDSNRSAQLKKLARVMKLQIQKKEILYYLGSEQQRC